MNLRGSLGSLLLWRSILGIYKGSDTDAPIHRMVTVTVW